ncbi:MAG: GGDEF domain-containing protein [Synergistaceae bacterium]|jgi:diguanylate cyclase (GGDEF)-like protein/PAS domain S-box-containing protein|nr:GGDEF domain-containing protein [Synergistaceae bacterium]
MSERTLDSDEYLMETDKERNRLLRYSIELERELMKMKRAEKVLHEMERRYLALMESAVFLYVILAPTGVFRVMNPRAENFFGFHLKFGMDVTLQSLSASGDTGEIESALKDALEKTTHAILPFVRADGAWGWLDMEFFSSTYQGESSVQIIASDITTLMKEKAGRTSASPPESEESFPYALQILNNCPGLLCFAVDKKGTLLYSTRGYREIAKRFLGHDCTAGFPYPVSLETSFDMDLQELLQDAFLGNTTATPLIEKWAGRINRWNVTAAPLTSSSGEIVGAIVHLTLMTQHVDRETPLLLANHEKLDAKEILRDVADRFDASQVELLNAIPRMFCIVDDKGLCIEANDCFLQTLKLGRDDVVGRAFASLALEGDALNERLSERLIYALQGKSFDDLECKVCAKDGEVLSLGLKGTRLRWGIDAMMLISCVDNTKLRRTEEQLKRVSTTDVSTGILNRQGMERILNTEIDRASRYRGSLSLIMLDIDGFRALNEQIGYAASDRILREVAAAVKARIRNVDYLGRWGGDEFMLLTPLPLATASQLAEKLRDMVQHNAFGENRFLTLSAGVAEYRKPMDVAALVAMTYDAMTEAKRSGGNRTIQARVEEWPQEVAEPESKKVTKSQ